MLGDPRDGPRDLAIVVVCASLPVLGLAGLGTRAVSNEAAATDRELASLVEAEAGRQRQRFSRDLSLAEGLLRLGRPSGLAYAREIVVAAEDPVVAKAPAPSLAEPDAACRALVVDLLRSTEAKRPAVRDALTGNCPLARSARGRFLVPWLLLERGSGEELEAWLGAHGERLEPVERASLAEAVAKAPFPGAARWLAGTSSAPPRATLSPDAVRALRRRALGPGEVAPLIDGGTFGRFVREPSGEHRGFVVSPETLANAIDAGALPVPSELALRLTPDPRGSATVPVVVGGDLRLFVGLRSPAIAARRTQQSRLSLVLAAVATATLAVGFLALLLRRMRAARRAGELRTDFVATVSHELRTPAASLQMLAELAAGEGLTTDERKEVGGALVRESRRLSQTVERLLSLRRMLAGKLTIARAEVDVSALLDEALASAELPASCRAYPPDLRGYLDAGALRLAVDNLLANARKHGRPPGIYYDREAGRVPARYESFLALPLAELEARLDRGEGVIAVRRREGAPPLITLAAPRRAQLAAVDTAFAALTTLPDAPVAVTLSPALSSGEIQTVVRGAKADFKGCYEKLLAREPRAAGRITLDFAVSPAGAVEGAKATATGSVDDAETVACFAEATGKLRFPSTATKGSTTVRYPLDLAP